MIYITGDTHGDFRRFSTDIFPEQKEMTKDDFVIICGDFGGIWCQEDNKKAMRMKTIGWTGWIKNLLPRFSSAEIMRISTGCPHFPSKTATVEMYM